MNTPQQNAHSRYSEALKKAVRTSITLWCHNKAVRIWYHRIHKKLTVFMIIQKTASQSEERICEPERGDVKLPWDGFWFLKPKVHLLGNCIIWQMCWINFAPHKTFATQIHIYQLAVILFPVFTIFPDRNQCNLTWGTKTVSRDSSTTWWRLIGI